MFLHKNNTMAILLKTTSVGLVPFKSCKLESKTRAKVFGKVDTTEMHLLAEHSLNILKGFKPVKQTLRRFSEPKRQAMGEELAKLLEAGFIRDIKHPDWLANLVMVPKKEKS